SSFMAMKRRNRLSGSEYCIWFFTCRACAGITYLSTLGHRWDRSARRIEKLRARLQWRADGTEPIKPRGMYERTFQQILGESVGTGLRSSVDGRCAIRQLGSLEWLGG